MAVTSQWAEPRAVGPGRLGPECRRHTAAGPPARRAGAAAGVTDKYRSNLNLNLNPISYRSTTNFNVRRSVTPGRGPPTVPMFKFNAVQLARRTRPGQDAGLGFHVPANR
jgi:hypothetical protein